MKIPKGAKLKDGKLPKGIIRLASMLYETYLVDLPDTIILEQYLNDLNTLGHSEGFKEYREYIKLMLNDEYKNKTKGFGVDWVINQVEIDLKKMTAHFKGIDPSNTAPGKIYVDMSKSTPTLSPEKRKRGRPRKVELSVGVAVAVVPVIEAKRKRGRPRKETVLSAVVVPVIEKRKPGRPRKQAA